MKNMSCFNLTSMSILRHFTLALLLMIVLLVSAAIGAIGITFLIIPIALYLLMLSLAAGTAKLLGVVDRLMIFIALPVMHLTWASGFWVGFVLGAKKTVDAGDKK